jgi:transglutaminase-like putative cysteine protease
MLILQHVSAEAEDVPASGTLVGVQLGSRLLGLSVSASVAVLVLTAALFFIIPRIGQAALYRPAVGRMLTGFTERVELGTIGRLETDTTVVMRVRVVDPLPTESWPSLRWRGVVLDHFDGRHWTAAPRRHAVLQGTAEEGYQVGSFRGVGPIVRQEIALEPLDNPVIFAAPRPLYVMVRTESVTLDDSGVISVPAAPARLRYAVESELERASRPGAPSRRRERLAADVRQRSLQLPPIAERIRHLARAVTAGSVDEVDAAHRLSTYLASGEFRYTLMLERQTELPPIEEFLFVRRSGNCEYFAAALAVMLRSLGIPARVVNGFQRGEWNPYGGYFMVRLLDAHAWVEAYVDGAWSTFDPSPRAFAGPAGGAASIGMYLDALRHRWFRYVINWSLYDQVNFAAHLRGMASTERWTAVMSARAPRGWMPVAGGLALVAAAAAFAARRWRRADVARTATRMPRFYRRALRILARGGLSPSAGETAREFSARVCAASPAVGTHLARLTAEYEHVRFGGAALTADTCTALDACLAELAGGLSGRP